jgi:hypothetical protein
MKRIGTTFTFVLLSLASMAQVSDTLWPVLPALPNPAAINIVILGDGYTNGQLGDGNLFDDHALAVKEELITNTSPFTEYANYFNIYRIDLESNETGVDDDCATPDCPHDIVGFPDSCVTNTFDTYFDVSHDGLSFANNPIHRLAVANFDSVASVLQANGFDTATTFVILLANCEGFYYPYSPGTAHGLGGGYWTHKTAVCPAATFGQDNVQYQSDEKVVIHEFTHAFAQVLDEYWTDYAEDYAAETWNMSSSSDPDSVPWKNWVDQGWFIGIEDTTITAYEDAGTLPIGVYPHRVFATTYDSINGHTQWEYNLDSVVGYFKPTTYYNCKMEDATNDVPLCSVCREATIERIHGLAPAMYGHGPDNNDTLTASEATNFNIDLIQTTNNTVVVEWQLNGDSITTNDGTWNLDCDLTEWNIGTNTLTAAVEDRTDFIRIDDHSDHTQTVSWTIEFNGAEADLWMRDLAGDQGNTAPPAPIPYGSYDHGPDLWVRNQTDGIIEHENPSYSQDSVFVYARVFNRGCKTSDPQRNLSTYFTLAGPANAWPSYFNGALPDTGNLIGTTVLNTAIVTGDSAIIEFEWNLNAINGTVLDSQNYNVCLLARLDSTVSDPITYDPSLGEYIYYNNNMVMHNMTIVDVDSAGFEVVNGNKYPPGGFILVGNPTTSNSVFDLHFDADLEQGGKPLSKEAEIYLVFDDNAWNIGSAIKDTDLSGLKRKDANTFIATSDNASISNISIPANTRVPLYIGFGFLTKEVEQDLEYDFQVTQWKSGDTGPMGGELYRVQRNQRYLFDADAGDDKEADKDQQVIVSAGDILEDATYNWYDMDGNLIYTGKDLTVTADITKKYKLEVIAELDGYKDYSEVEVKVKMGEITGISPNPASYQASVSYHTQGGSSAYLAVYNTITGSSDQYIQPLGQGALNIDLSAYRTGNYEVLLVTDGVVRDTESLMVE